MTPARHETRETIQCVLIVALCIGAAIAYGIIHDQVTARVCVEYFTLGHPPIFHTTSPTLLGIGWGIIATWWVGALLGVPLAVAARGGARPPLSARNLVRPICVLLAIMAASALLAGVTGWTLGRSGRIRLMEPMFARSPEEWNARFLADLWAHAASYAVGFAGGIILIVRTWCVRDATAGVSGP